MENVVLKIKEIFMFSFDLCMFSIGIQSHALLYLLGACGDLMCSSSTLQEPLIFFLKYEYFDSSHLFLGLKKQQIKTAYAFIYFQGLKKADIGSYLGTYEWNRSSP